MRCARPCLSGLLCCAAMDAGAAIATPAGLVCVALGRYHRASCARHKTAPSCKQPHDLRRTNSTTGITNASSPPAALQSPVKFSLKPPALKEVLYRLLDTGLARPRVVTVLGIGLTGRLGALEAGEVRGCTRDAVGSQLGRIG
jgi:hypothetical protein